MTPKPIVFLIDVDHTLLDNDRIHSDLNYDLSALLTSQRSRISAEGTP
jgi:hypothetical protein